MRRWEVAWDWLNACMYVVEYGATLQLEGMPPPTHRVRITVNSKQRLIHHFRVRSSLFTRLLAPPVSSSLQPLHEPATRWQSV